MADAPKQVPFLTLTISNFNPNHRIRLVGFSAPVRYLFDVSTALKDDSFYLAPKLSQETSLEEQNPGQEIRRHTVPAAGDFHFSFHETGAVNLHVSGNRTPLRLSGEGRGERGLALRLVFNSLGLFQPASLEEFNSLPRRYTPIPIGGIGEQYPLCLDIYQWSRDQPWSMPTLGDIHQFHVRVQPQRKSYDYHILAWQHTMAERYSADVALLYSPVASTSPKRAD
jgi:hypothetical protein